MALALDDKWIWDFWLVYHAGLWHAYFLQADKSLIDPERRHRNVSVGHATSPDLRNWSHLGTCFGPSEREAWDDWTTWTGSVVQGPEGTWHLFYTGTAHAGAGLHQRIGHATSTDLHAWQRVGDGLALDISGPEYEEYTPGHWHDRAMRDPWVIKNPDGPGWQMYFTARVPNVTEPNAGGAIGFATSLDLFSWSLQKPVYAGGMFGQMEVPQVFESGRRWYCLFTTWAEHWSEAYRHLNPQPPVSGTHYLTAPSARGPWTIAPGNFLDGAQPCRRYSGKIVSTGEGLAMMGFIHTTPDSLFVGEVSDPIPVTVDADGLLKLHPDRVMPGSRI